MTTRKRIAIGGLVMGALALGGCATPGTLHVYSLANDPGERAITDRGGERDVEARSFLEPEEGLTGFAYDPFTDHFFLRLTPGNKIRVVDRPARAIKREFEIEGAPATGGDLTVRPRDGHMFLLAGDQVIETTRLGKLVRTFSLNGAEGRPIGVAFDAGQNRLLVLGASGRRVTVHDFQGARLAEIALAESAGGCLAFDSEKRELYAPLRNREGTIGVFAETGKLLRMTPAAGPFVDVGPRSFVRVF